MGKLDENYLVNIFINNSEGQQMKSIFEFKDYKKFIHSWISNQANEGHGEFRKMALALNVSSTLISQIFNGEKDISLELSCELTEYLQLDDLESEYFIILVEHSKAGSFKLKKKFERQIEEKQNKFKKLENRSKNATELDNETKAIFYSSWIYSAIRLLVDIEGYNDAQVISQKLNLQKNQVQKVLDFLFEHNLITKKNIKYSIGPTRTYIGSSHHIVNKHHQNWRLLGFQKMIHSNENNFFYTAPMTLSKEVAEEIRRQLPGFVEEIIKKVQPSKSETLYSLNIDWFEI